MSTIRTTTNAPTVTQAQNAQHAKAAQVKKAGEGIQFKDGVGTAAPTVPTMNAGLVSELSARAEVVDVSAVTAGFSALVEQMGNARPPVAAAAFLETTTPLEQGAVSVVDLAIDLTTQEEVHHEQLTTLIVEGEKVESSVFERLTNTLSHNNRQTLTTLHHGIQNAFKEQVTKGKSHNVTLPSSASKAIEDAMSSFGGMDVEAMVQLVLMACAKDAAFDLKQMLDAMQTTNKKKAAMRVALSEEKKARAAAEALLRAEYDRRCQLTGDDAIDPERLSFEDYQLGQMLVRTASGDYTLSDNYTVYPRKLPEHRDAHGVIIAQHLVDRAAKLGIPPAVMQELWIKFEKVISKQAAPHFDTMDDWLLNPATKGGVGLAFGGNIDTKAQEKRARAYLAQQEDGYAINTLSITYKIPLKQAQKLVAIWEASGGALKLQYGGDITRWLADGPPFGLSMTSLPNDPMKAEVVDAFIKGYEALEALQPLLREYGTLQPSDLHALQVYTAANPGKTVAQLLSEIGCKAGDANNAKMIFDFLTAQADPKQSAEYRTWEAEVAKWPAYDAREAERKRLQADHDVAMRPAVVFDIARALHVQALEHKQKQLNELLAIPPAERKADFGNVLVSRINAVMHATMALMAYHPAKRPPEPPPLVLPDSLPKPTMTHPFRASPELNARVTAGEAALRARTEAQSHDGETRDTIELTTTGDLAANVASLAKEVDHTPKQPPRKDVPGERSLRAIDAEIEKAKAEFDTLGDMSQEQALQMQIVQERRTKFMEALSNTMKKLSDASQSIIGNMK